MKPSGVLTADIVSPQDLAALLVEIRQYNAWYQSEVIKQRTQVASQIIPPKISKTAVHLLGSVAVDGRLSPEALNQLLQALEHTKRTAPVITITLADLPTNDLRTKLATWCRANIAPEILVQFTCNRRILGGMVVRYGSKIHDWSFRTKLIANKGSLPEVLRRV